MISLGALHSPYMGNIQYNVRTVGFSYGKRYYLIISLKKKLALNDNFKHGEVEIEIILKLESRLSEHLFGHCNPSIETYTLANKKK